MPKTASAGAVDGEAAKQIDGAQDPGLPSLATLMAVMLIAVANRLKAHMQDTQATARDSASVDIEQPLVTQILIGRDVTFHVHFRRVRRKTLGGETFARRTAFRLRKVRLRRR